MTPSLAWRTTALAGLAVIACLVVFRLIPNLASCGPDQGLGPVMAFELAARPADFAALFGADPCRGPLIAAMRRMLWIDALAFIPAYSALLVFPLVALRGNGPKLAAAAIAAIIAAALFDEFEGVQSFAILANLSANAPADPASIALLIPAVRAKFALLALATMAIGWLLAREGGWARLSGLVVTAGAALMIAGLAGNAWAGLLTLGGLVAWTWLFVLAFWRAWRIRRITV